MEVISMGIGLDVMCDKCGEIEAGMGMTFADCRYLMKQHGWSFKRGNIAYCDNCTWDMNNPEQDNQ